VNFASNRLTRGAWRIVLASSRASFVDREGAGLCFEALRCARNGVMVGTLVSTETDERYSRAQIYAFGRQIG
jgi:hypothetical protein